MEIADYSKTVAEDIRALLARRSIGRGWLADQIGMHRHTLRSRLNGEIPFQVGEVAAIADVLDLDVLEVMPTFAKGSAA